MGYVEVVLHSIAFPFSSVDPTARRLLLQLPSQTFSTTTTVSISTDFQQSQHNDAAFSTMDMMNASCAVDFVSSGHDHSAIISQEEPADMQRVTRSMTALDDESMREARQPRVRSVSPIRPPMDIQELGGAESTDDPHPHGASYGNAQYPHRRTRSSTGLNRRTSVSSEVFGNSSSFVDSSSSTGFLTPVASSAPATGSLFATDLGSERRTAAPQIGLGRRHLASRQKSITISAAQFLQQQQTIAALIRQQQELKQIIGVLQEQQQQLMSVPVQLNELKLDNAKGYVYVSSLSMQRLFLTLLLS